MSVYAIDHVQLAMPAGREDEARTFCALLGLTEVAKPAALAGRGGAWFEAGSAKLHYGVEGAFEPARKAHPALRVRGLPALIGKLAQAGCRVEHDVPLPGYTRAHVYDPFGNRIELMEATHA